MLGFQRPDLLPLLLLAVPIAALAWRSKRSLSATRWTGALIARALLLTSLVFALSELTWYHESTNLAVVFVIDQSASMGQSADDALDFIRSALSHQGDDDLIGLVSTGANSLVEFEARPQVSLRSIETLPSPHQTDLASGLRLAAALLPSDRTGRIVLLSDGEQTRGDAAQQVLLTAGSEVSIDVVPFKREHGADLRLDALMGPAQVDEDATFEIRVSATADVPTPAKLRLYQNDRLLGETSVQLSGDQTDVFRFKQVATRSGLFRYRAVIDAESNDAIKQNNEVMKTIQVTGRPRILLVSDQPNPPLAQVMTQQGFVLDQVNASEIPETLGELRVYSAVILSNVPAYLMGRQQQLALERYVKDLGRGLMMLGGDHSFGLGGYYNTPIARALPVKMSLDDSAQYPKLAMVLALDKSGSMGSGVGSPIELAKEAALQTLELLSARDMLGVIGFDGAASWIVPLVELTNPTPIVEQIGSIRSGGGTDIYPAIKRAVEGLALTDAASKHLIVLSDGDSAPGDYQTLLKAATDDKITLSTVATGAGADTAFMKKLAALGGGNDYIVEDLDAIPAIFTRETMLASRAFLIEDPFTPLRGDYSELLKGWSELPTLYGAVATSAKGRAQVPLLIPKATPDLPEIPLLAHWRYGLGRSVAFTSDATNRWSKEWVGSPSYTHFWTQIARWLAADTQSSNLETQVDLEEGLLTVTVDVFDDQGEFYNFLEGEARVIAPDLSVRSLKLRQVGPGRYRGQISAEQDGSWLVGMSLSRGDELIGQSVAEAVQPYSPEYKKSSDGHALLSELAQLGQGEVLTNPARVFRRPRKARQIPRPLWPELLALAGFLLLLDVAVRRLDLGFSRSTSGHAPSAHAPPAQSISSDPIEPNDAKRPEKTAEKDAENPYVGGLLKARKKAQKRTGRRR